MISFVGNLLTFARANFWKEFQIVTIKYKFKNFHQPFPSKFNFSAPIEESFFTMSKIILIQFFFAMLQTNFPIPFWRIDATIFIQVSNLREEVSLQTKSFYVFRKIFSNHYGKIYGMAHGKLYIFEMCWAYNNF